MPACRSCDQEWTFSVLEQALFHEKGYEHDPSRCKDCRDQRKKRQVRQTAESSGYVGTCSDCGCEARVPFRPSPGRPIYCSDCFRQRRRAG